jgi:hypothetical protein
MLTSIGYPTETLLIMKQLCEFWLLLHDHGACEDNLQFVWWLFGMLRDMKVRCWTLDVLYEIQMTNLLWNTKW